MTLPTGSPQRAIELGYGGTAIIGTSDPPTDVPWISTLEDLAPMTGR
jgi:hypothetical protein